MNEQVKPQLTEAQEKVLIYIKDHVSQKSYPPSTRDISTHFGFSSQTAARSYIKALEKKGYIKHTPGKARALQVLIKTAHDSIIDLISTHRIRSFEVSSVMSNGSQKWAVRMFSQYGIHYFHEGLMDSYEEACHALMQVWRKRD